MTEIITPSKISLWTEDKAPENVYGCSRCELCNHKSRIIWGEGNPQGKVIIVLDNPGRREDNEGQPFVCGARQALQAAAYAAGFDQNDIYVTYILKCRPKRAYDKDTARSQCIGYFNEQLKLGSFKALFCLGDTAVKTFFGDPELTVKNTRGTWHNIRGIPTYTSYHPFAVRRRPNLYNIFLKDWQAVRDYLIR
jgi:DNA polymerase